LVNLTNPSISGGNPSTKAKENTSGFVLQGGPTTPVITGGAIESKLTG